MNPAWRHMALAVFDKQDSDQLTVEEIDQVINRYPYFAVLHYLKAGKLMLEQAPDANTSAAKAALFFPNPHWLNQKLRHQEEMQVDSTEALAELMITPHHEALIASQEELNQPGAGQMQEEQEAEYDSKRVFEEEEANDTGDYQQEHLAHTVLEEEEANDTGDDQQEHIAHTVLDEEEANDTGDYQQEQIALTDEGVAADGLEMDGAASQQWSQEDKAESQTGLQISREEVLQGEAPPAGETEAMIPIEPLYTIDYFASQGIKLPVEDVPGDQLAVRLRSFTEWLKSMKRIQPEKMDRQLDQETEKQIRQTAEHSNENMDLYTESLAEVYRKQGLDDRAVEVYQKLSLLDPAKSAYFAARIREIKEI